MKKWKNPYITLKICRSASFSEVRKAEKNCGISEDDKNIAKAASEELTENVNKIFPAFLMAVDHVISLDAEIKLLRKLNQNSSKLSDEIKNDAFFQMGVLTSSNYGEVIEVDVSKISKILESVNLKTMFDDISKNEKGSSIFKPDPGELKSAFVTPFKIPQLIK